MRVKPRKEKMKLKMNTNFFGGFTIRDKQGISMRLGPDKKDKMMIIIIFDFGYYLVWTKVERSQDSLCDRPMEI